ncbi:MAG: PAS domain-containing protein [Desulfobacterales bacterium]|nr:PAS domain-containing protein [Desulfobacterales bacterium]
MAMTKLDEMEVSAEHLLKMLDELVDHVSIIDKDFNVLWGNKLAKCNFGEKLIGMKCYTAYHGRNAPCPECLVQKTYEDGQVHEHEVMVRPEGREPMYFHCNSYVLKRDKEGKPEVVIEVSKIITDNVKLQKDMERIIKITNDREEEMIKLKEKIMVLEQKISEKPIAEKRK